MCRIRNLLYVKLQDVPMIKKAITNDHYFFHFYSDAREMQTAYYHASLNEFFLQVLYNTKSITIHDQYLLHRYLLPKGMRHVYVHFH